MAGHDRLRIVSPFFEKHSLNERGSSLETAGRYVLSFFFFLESAFFTRCMHVTTKTRAGAWASRLVGSGWYSVSMCCELACSGEVWLGHMALAFIHNPPPHRPPVGPPSATV